MSLRLREWLGKDDAVTEHFTPHIIFGLDPIWFAAVLLCVTYAVIIWDRVNRAIIALVAAGIAVLAGALDQAEALKGIDWNTIGTLDRADDHHLDRPAFGRVPICRHPLGAACPRASSRAVCCSFSW